MRDIAVLHFKLTPKIFETVENHEYISQELIARRENTQIAEVKSRKVFSRNVLIGVHEIQRVVSYACLLKSEA